MCWMVHRTMTIGNDLSVMDQEHGLMVILYLASLPSAGLADLEVSQSPASLTVIQGDQAKLRCLFSAVDPHVKGAVSWHKAGLEENSSSSHVISLRGRFSLAFPRTFLGQGDGSLVISNITWEDAGIYYCKVLTWEKEEEQGSGTRLIVHAHPSQPEIYLKVAMKSEGKVDFMCRTSGFYPADINVSWHSAEVLLPDHGPLEISKSQQGILQANLHLVLPRSFIYHLMTVSCVIQHTSLTGPLYSNYTYNLSETGYQLVEYLNILKISLILGLTVSMLYTVRKRCSHK